MALTRSQLIAGDASKGTVLAGQVQGVKQGDGVLIGPDGTISFRPSTAQGVVKLNNPSAYNAYVWPNSGGTAGSYLGSDGQGNLSWSVPPGIVTLGEAPSAPSLGQLWFSYATELLYVYQNKEGSGVWKPASQGINPSPGNVSSDPLFAGGTGSFADPYVIGSTTTRTGNTILFPSTITITGLAPYQYVSILDNFAQDNEYRFQPTSTFADDSGVLKFKIKYTDYPRTPSGTSYSASFRLGFDQPVYLTAAVGIVSPVNLLNPGSISGTPIVGEVLSYTEGLASGGTPPYVYTWKWKSELTGTTLQEGGATYVIAPAAADDRVFVELTATDSSLDSATGNTTFVPTPPAFIGKSTFPNTNILFPSTLTSTVSTLWEDAGTTLSSSGCIEFSSDGISYGQGPTVVANTGTITTRWINSPSCSGSSNSETLVGCIYSDRYQQCATITLDKVPSPFTFNPVLDIPPGTVATSQDVTPIGYNSVAYVTYNAASTGSTVQASVNGGAWTTLSTIGATNLPISPGQSLRVRMTTGPAFETDYSAIIYIGAGTSVQIGTFVARTSPSTSFTTPISFPTTTISEAESVAWLAGDGSTTLTATGCIEFKVGTGGTWTGDGDAPVAVTTGDILFTRWASGTPGSCAEATHGTNITGTVTNVPSGGTKTSVAALSVDRVPGMFSFNDLAGQSPSTVITSNVINVTGINAPVYVTRGTSTLTSIQASIGGGAWTSVPTSGETLVINPVVSGPGTTLQIRGTTGSANSTGYTAVINIGQGSFINTDTWNVTTSALTPSIVTPSIVTPVNGASNINPNSSSPAGVTVTSSAYSAINGAGSHTGSDWEVYYLDSSTPVYIVQVTDSPTNLTSYFIPAASLTTSRTYYARVRYRTNTPSPLASNWSPVSSFTTATSFSLQWAVRYNPGTTSLYAALNYAVGSDYTLFTGTESDVYRTADGINFQRLQNVLSPLPSYSLCRGMAYVPSGNEFYAVFGSNTVGSTLKSSGSSNGVSWASCASSTPNVLIDLAYSPSLNMLCAVGPGGQIFTATPGASITWVARTSGTGQLLSSIIWDGTAFYACGGTALLKSTNGTSWSLTTIALSPDNYGLGQITYNSQSGVYYIARSEAYPEVGTGSTYGMRSTDGSTWTQVIAPFPIRWVATGGNWFVGGTTQNFTSSPVRVLTSSDASTWTESYTNNSYNGVQTIAYMPSQNRFVFSSLNWVMFSSV